MSKGDGQGFSRDVRVVGYLRTLSRDNLFITDQDSRIEVYASREGIDIVLVEREANNGNQICRTGLWKTLRHISCSACEPKSMPMTDDYSYWMREALKGCICAKPEPLHGLIVTDMEIITPNPQAGTKFLLDMCLAKKHLYTVFDKRCMSCCNPQAVEFVRKQLQKDIDK